MQIKDAWTFNKVKGRYAYFTSFFFTNVCNAESFTCQRSEITRILLFSIITKIVFSLCFFYVGLRFIGTTSFKRMQYYLLLPIFCSISKYDTTINHIIEQNTLHSLSENIWFTIEMGCETEKRICVVSITYSSKTNGFYRFLLQQSLQKIS